MIASANSNIMDDLKILTQIANFINNIILLDSMGMRCRKQTMKDIPLSQFYKVIYSVVKEMESKKFNVYKNSQKTSLRVKIL